MNGNQRSECSRQHAVTVMVDDARCFDIVADIKDDMTEGGWNVRLRKPQLLLRVHRPVTAKQQWLAADGAIA